MASYVERVSVEDKKFPTDHTLSFKVSLVAMSGHHPVLLFYFVAFFVLLASLLEKILTKQV